MTEQVKSKSLEKAKKASQSAELDRELEDTFPASDPSSLTQPMTVGAPTHIAPKKKPVQDD